MLCWMRLVDELCEHSDPGLLSLNMVAKADSAYGWSLADGY